MDTLTNREYRQLKKAAKEFARSAAPDRTYYIVDTVGGVRAGRYINEIRFTKKPFVGLTWGAYTPESLYIQRGGVYRERDHRDIRNLPTWTEQRESDAKYEEAFLSSPEWADEVSGVAVGTRFRRQF